MNDWYPILRKDLFHLVQIIRLFLIRVKPGNEGDFLSLLGKGEDGNECAFYSRPRSK